MSLKGGNTMERNKMFMLLCVPVLLPGGQRALGGAPAGLLSRRAGAGVPGSGHRGVLCPHRGDGDAGRASAGRAAAGQFRRGQPHPGHGLQPRLRGGYTDYISNDGKTLYTVLYAAQGDTLYGGFYEAENELVTFDGALNILYRYSLAEKGIAQYSGIDMERHHFA